MNFRKAQKLRDTLLVVGFVMSLGGYLYDLLVIPGCILMCSCLIPHFLYFRCPRCDKLLGKYAVKYCPHCGYRLDEMDANDYGNDG